MAIVSAFCNQYKGDIIGVTAANQNIASDVYKCALYTTSRATLDKTTTVYDDIAENNVMLLSVVGAL